AGRFPDPDQSGHRFYHRGFGIAGSSLSGAGQGLFSGGINWDRSSDTWRAASGMLLFLLGRKHRDGVFGPLPAEVKFGNFADDRQLTDRIAVTGLNRLFALRKQDHQLVADLN